MNEFTEDEMRQVIIAAGYKTLWNENNWIHPSWRDIKGVDIDRAGDSTLNTYNRIMRSRRRKEISDKYEAEMAIERKKWL